MDKICNFWKGFLNNCGHVLCDCKYIVYNRWVAYGEKKYSIFKNLPFFCDIKHFQAK
jgi:hypothetical protein